MNRFGSLASSLGLRRKRRTYLRKLEFLGTSGDSTCRAKTVASSTSYRIFAQLKTLFAESLNFTSSATRLCLEINLPAKWLALNKQSLLPFFSPPYDSFLPPSKCHVNWLSFHVALPCMLSRHISFLPKDSGRNCPSGARLPRALISPFALSNCY